MSHDYDTFDDQLTKAMADFAVIGEDIPEVEFIEELHEATLMKASKRAEFKGETGIWRRMSGFNIFIRDEDSVIRTGPRALQGQKVDNISLDDFKAIPFVKEAYEKKGKKAIPGSDIEEVFGGVSKTTMTADHAVAEVRRGIKRILVTLYSRDTKQRKSKVDEKSFTFSGDKAEVQAFEDAKVWARMRLRDKGKKKIKA